MVNRHRLSKAEQQRFMEAGIRAEIRRLQGLMTDSGLSMAASQRKYIDARAENLKPGRRRLTARQRAALSKRMKAMWTKKRGEGGLR
jgi:hypothetical protein